MTSSFCLRRARILALENLVVLDVVSLRCASTKAERQTLQQHLTALLDERDGLLAEVAA